MYFSIYFYQVGKVWNFVGSTAGVLVLYIYPAAFFMRLKYVRNKKRASEENTSIMSQYTPKDYVMEGVAAVLLVVGAILFVLQNYDAIKAVIPTHSPPANSTLKNPIPSCYIIHCNSSQYENSSSYSYYWICFVVCLYVCFWHWHMLYTVFLCTLYFAYFYKVLQVVLHLAIFICIVLHWIKLCNNLW